MRSTQQITARWFGLFLTLIGLTWLTAPSAHLPLSSERVAMAAQSAPNSPGSLIFRSDDRGETWGAVGSLPDAFMLAPDPSGNGTIYAGTSVGIYKSINGGAWTLSANGLPREPVKAIVVDPKNTNVVYAGTLNSKFTGTVYKSVDGGSNWMKSDNGMKAYSVYALAIRPVNSETIFAATSAGMFKSVDGGASWVAINNGLTFTAHGSTSPFAISTIAIEPANANVIYAAAFPSTVFPPSLRKSVDGGNSWNLIGFTWGFHSITVDPLNPSTLFGGYDGRYDSGVVKSTDGGAALQKVLPDQLSNSAFIANLAIDPVTPSTVYAGINNSVLLGEAFVRTPPGFIKSGFYKSVDGGGNWSLKTGGLPDAGIAALAIDPRTPSRLYAATAPAAVSVSAASYRDVGLARESIAAMFGPGLANMTAQAASIPLPVSLANISIKVRDERGVERDAPLFFVSPSQVNYLIPAETAYGVATAIVRKGDEVISVEGVNIQFVEPGVFSANASGNGVAAGVALRIKADGSQSYEAVARYDQAQNSFVAVPIDLGSETDQVFLLLFGTGWRFRSSESAVKVTVGGVDVPVTYAGLQPTLVGLDQINVRLPRTLAGKGEVDVAVTVDGKTANTTRVSIR